MSRIQVSPFLRNALLIDAAGSAATGALVLVGANALAPLFNLPIALLHGAGAAIVPFVIWLVWMGTRRALPLAMVNAAIGINLIWVAASFALLAFLAPTPLGYAFIIAQALAVAFFAALEWMGVKRSAATA
ncbi:MAG: hypothetical protein AB7J28_02295 [Hyphomonadaceae bacterium]